MRTERRLYFREIPISPLVNHALATISFIQWRYERRYKDKKDRCNDDSSNNNNQNSIKHPNRRDTQAHDTTQNLSRHRQDLRGDLGAHRRRIRPRRNLRHHPARRNACTRRARRTIPRQCATRRRTRAPTRRRCNRAQPTRQGNHAPRDDLHQSLPEPLGSRRAGRSAERRPPVAVRLVGGQTPAGRLDGQHRGMARPVRRMARAGTQGRRRPRRRRERTRRGSRPAAPLGFDP